MAKLADLPNELLTSIAAYMNQYELPSLALVYSRFRVAAEHNLYRSPFLQGHRAQFYAHDTIPRLHSFAKTLLRRPDLASKVRHLFMVTAKYSDDPTHYKYSPEEELAGNLV
ncbi:hypothetical protein EK21DRAFT_118376 [Setomelanomma holmii]|uniref:F-box domain-containing protein n=1 Tax=Setomelanomma holmii TaxID=210430 RepID=A0A9P4GYK3_9PLEO|nr:hypothetical protein EK21DRAFT_118376 [Setomelanomma holmii]